MSKGKKLIQVHCEESQILHCSCCDGLSKEVNLFYKELNPDGKYFEFQTYLECCVKTLGEVIDWCSYEDYQKPSKKIKLAGIPMTVPTGYKA